MVYRLQQGAGNPNLHPNLLGALILQPSALDVALHFKIASATTDQMHTIQLFAILLIIRLLLTDSLLTIIHVAVQFVNECIQLLPFIVR